MSEFRVLKLRHGWNVCSVECVVWSVECVVWSVELRWGSPLCGKTVGVKRAELLLSVECGVEVVIQHGIPKGRVPLVGRRATPYIIVDS
jgi:hypothetical protein